MLYNIGWSPIQLMAAISEDGITWQPDPHPELKFPQDAGERLADHHIYTLRDAVAGGLYRDPIAEDGFPFKYFVQLGGATVYQRALKDRSHPWHEVAVAEGRKRYMHEEIMLISKDGQQWQPQYEYRWSLPDWHPEPPYFAFYHRGLQQHVMIVRPGWGDRRVCLQKTADFQRWSGPEFLLQMDPLDKAPVGFYTMPVFPYGHMYIGLLWVFHNSSSRPVSSFNQFFGTMDAQLTYSYDGLRFVRGFREPLLPNTAYPEHGCTQLRPYSMVESDNEIRIYSGASRAEHGRERALQRSGVRAQAIVLHRLRRDGWMFLRSEGDWARLQTKPLGIWSPEITLNAAAPYGVVRYQITDETSRPIEGFTFDDCVPLENDDRFDWPIRWKNANTQDLLNKVIRLELEFRNANIYSLSMAYHMLDAQDHWLMKEGQSIDPSRFDY